MNLSIVTLLLLVCVALGSAYDLMIVPPTQGEPWPMPQSRDKTGDYMLVSPATFQFSITGYTCDILTNATERYMTIMFPPSKSRRQQTEINRRNHRANRDFSGNLDVVSVYLSEPCETYPHIYMDESYTIQIDSAANPKDGEISSQSIWGILRGLETFSQLLMKQDYQYRILSTEITDYPRFPHRGFLIDCSRHYLPIDVIFQILDLLSMDKFNLLHWHIVDDQSFPYVSVAYPDLSGEGAWTQEHVYTQADIAGVIEYGRLRGIRVVPEFDTPGHTYSWGYGQPGLLTPCYTNSVPNGDYGPIDPSNPDNYIFLNNLFQEVTQTFPDSFIHLGGDEVIFDCWKSNPNITSFMESMGFPGNYYKLEEYYFNQVVGIIKNLSSDYRYTVWEEVFNNGVRLASDAIVHVWKNGDNPVLYKAELERVTAAGYETLLSSCWYLNDISYGVDWYQYYQCDPQDFNGTPDQKDLVLGGEACMWGEYVDQANVISRTWPRISPVGERLWSDKTMTADVSAAEPRLAEHRCRQLTRGYMAEPLNPSYCNLTFTHL